MLPDLLEEEFVNCMKNPRIVAYMSSVGVSVHDVQHLFKIVANENDEVDIDRFVDGCISVSSTPFGPSFRSVNCRTDTDQHNMRCVRCVLGRPARLRLVMTRCISLPLPHTSPSHSIEVWPSRAQPLPWICRNNSTTSRSFRRSFRTGSDAIGPRSWHLDD